MEILFFPFLSCLWTKHTRIMCEVTEDKQRFKEKETEHFSNQAKLGQMTERNIILLSPAHSSVMFWDFVN